MGKLETQTMNLNYIRTFVVLGQSKTKREAAQKLGVDISNVSRHINHLEIILNTKLVIGDDKSGILLTKAGKFFFKKYEKFYNGILLAEKEYTQTKNVNSGKITLGINPEIDEDVLNKINSFKIKYPNVTIKIVSLPTDELFEKLLQASIDIVIDDIENNVKKSDKIKSKHYYDEKYCIVYSDLYFKNKLNSLKELNKKPLILPTRSKDERNQFDSLLNEEGIEENISFEFSMNDVGRFYAVNGKGFALLPNRYIKNTDLKSFPLKIKKPIYLSYIEYNLSPTVQEFLKEFK